MPSRQVHCAISKDRTGFDFEELHRWIDEPYETLGENHRIVRHAFNKSEEQQIKDFWDNKKGSGWGDKAIIEWLFHIAMDNLETAFKFAKRKHGEDTFNFFRFGLAPDSRFVFFDAESLDIEDLEGEFEDCYDYEDDE